MGKWQNTKHILKLRKDLRDAYKKSDLNQSKEEIIKIYNNYLDNNSFNKKIRSYIFAKRYSKLLQNLGENRRIEDPVSISMTDFVVALLDLMKDVGMIGVAALAGVLANESLDIEVVSTGMISYVRFAVTILVFSMFIKFILGFTHISKSCSVKYRLLWQFEREKIEELYLDIQRISLQSN